MLITEHAHRRGKERVGLSVRAFDRLAEKAWALGYCAKDFRHGKMSKYFDQLYAFNQTAGAVRLYGQHAYIFTRDGILITVLHIPPSHRNYKMYLKND